MTPGERAAIEKRDAVRVGSYWDWRQSDDDRHALLDELRRVEQQRDRAMSMLAWIAAYQFDVPSYDAEQLTGELATLKAEIAGEKEKSGGARQD